MDGVSGAASGMAVVSLALQLGGSIKQLYDFWGSVKGAPDDIRAITTDLSLLSSVLAEMAFEEQHFGPDPKLATILEACCERVNKLAHLTNDTEPGFASMSLRIRKWTALKAVLKGERIQKFHKMLEGLKITLMLAQQNHHSRLNRIRYQSQQQDLTTITKHLSSLKLEQASATITTISNGSSVVNDRTKPFHGEESRICRTIRNPVPRVTFELGSDVALKGLDSNLPRDQSTTSLPLASPGADRSASYFDEALLRSKQQIRTKDVLSIRESIIRTLFGAITTTTTTKIRLSRSEISEDDALDSEDYQYEQESSYRILPAPWLLKLGFSYAYEFYTHNSSTQGWQFGIKPINLVPDDASIFESCRQGNIEKVRNLISSNLASVRDVNSEGRTALHFAAGSHRPELCKFLLEAGADKTARSFTPWLRKSPLQEVPWHPITKDGLANAIDTCRIFEASFDFWDEDGHGWDVLKWIPIYNCDQSTAEAGATHTFLSWFIQSSSQDIKANYNTMTVFNIMLYAYPGAAEDVGLLLEMGPPGAVDKLTEISNTYFGQTILHLLVTKRRWESIKSLLALGSNPHHVLFNDYLSPRAESPFSLAIYSSWGFWSFRDALHGMKLDIGDFARQELEQGCPLLDAGWQMETLSALLQFEFEPDRDPWHRQLGRCAEDFICSSCCFPITDLQVQVQPYWQGILESIKNGTYPQKSYPDAQEEQLSISHTHLSVSNTNSRPNTTDGSAMSHDLDCSKDQAAQPEEETSARKDAISNIICDREEVWCIWCWYHFKETGRRYSPVIIETDEDDSSDDDFSPFLFNI